RQPEIGQAESSRMGNIIMNLQLEIKTTTLPNKMVACATQYISKFLIHFPFFVFGINLIFGENIHMGHETAESQAEPILHTKESRGNKLQIYSEYAHPHFVCILKPFLDSLDKAIRV
ncbi:hypothetical protein ACJX0J_016620, partial [Zea mays]